MKMLLLILCCLVAIARGAGNVPFAFNGEWNPPCPENLVLWFKADNLSTNFGSGAFPYVENSTNHFSCDAGGGGSSAPLITNFPGPLSIYPSIRSIRFLQGRNFEIPTGALTSILTHSSCEVFAVIKANSDPASSGIFNWMHNWASGTPAVEANMAFPFSDGKIYDAFFSTGRRNIDPSPSLATTPRLYNVMSANAAWTATNYNNGTNTWLESSNSWIQRLDTSVLQFDSTNIFGVRTPGEAFKLGANSTSGGGSYSDGFLYELLLYRTNLVLRDRRYVENHLRTKWRLNGWTGVP